MKIAVIGAGIAGLSAAIALRMKGAEVEIFEQATELKELGAGLQISPNGVRILKALDVKYEGEFEPVSVMMIDGKSAKTIFELPFKEISRQRWGDRFIQIRRSDLHKALLDRAKALDITIHLGRSMDIVKQNDIKHSYHYIISADGVHSTSRKMLGQSQKASYSGNVAYRATLPIDELNSPPPPSAIIWSGAKQHAVTTRISAGKVVNLVCVCEEESWEKEGWNHPIENQILLEKFEGWNSSLLEIIRKSPEMNRWALLYHPSLKSFHKDNIVLIGDAAHPMLPSFAQGAVQALEDAYLLAECLFQGTLDDFDKLRVHRVTKVQNASRQNLETYHFGAFKRGAFNLAAKSANQIYPEFLLKRLDWLYGYDAISEARSYF